jgi:superfamily I DNA/RNA helicase
MPKIKLEGEQVCAKIIEDFYAQGSFIEALNMEVPAACEKMAGFKPNSTEHIFVKALAIFWPIFERVLKENPGKPVLTFNRAFLLLGENDESAAKEFSSASLRPFTHLLIDEFQDISPQIASFLKATQRKVIAQGKAPTLMAIGDDWQSIYGWRGSAPEMFVRFDEFFPVHPTLEGALKCFMMDNYRSIEAIIRDAEVFLSPVKMKIKKEAHAKRATEDGDWGVHLIEKGKQDFNKREETLVSAVVAEARKQYEFISRHPSKQKDKNKLIIMASANTIINAVEKELKDLAKNKDIIFETYHRSKGLQAEIAILCGDCTAKEGYPLKDAIYAASGLFKQSYVQSAKDEAMRLAYVAATRGIRRVIWVIDEPKGALSFWQANRKVAEAVS